MTPSERGKVIHRIGDLIEQHADELAMLETLDNGKPLTIAKAADVALSADLFHYMSGWATKIEGNTIPISARHLTRIRVPCLHPQGAGGRRRADHSVELPVADGGLEARTGAGGRRDRGAQARRADAALGAATR